MATRKTKKQKEQLEKKRNYMQARRDLDNQSTQLKSSTIDKPQKCQTEEEKEPNVGKHLQRSPNNSDSSDPEELQFSDKNSQKLLNLYRQQNKQLNVKVQSLNRRQREIKAELSTIRKEVSILQSTKDEVLQVKQMLSAFISHTALALNNTGSIALKKLMESYERHCGDKGIDLKLVEKQVNNMKAHGHEILERTCNNVRFWNYYKQLHYLQFAVYMNVLHFRSSKPSTINNNFNSLRIIASLYQDKGFDVIDHEELLQCAQLVQTTYQSLRSLNTIKGYLAHFNKMVTTVYGFAEFRAKVEYRTFGNYKPLITKNELLQIIKFYSSSKDSLLQLLGFFLYLLLQTGQRNETIRTIQFDQFKEELVGDKKSYFVETYAAKTGKSNITYITKSAYEFVQNVKNHREQWINEKKQQLTGDEVDFDERLNLLARRSLYLFTFYRQSSLHSHIKKMKSIFKDKFNNINKFIIHNIRAIRIKSVFEEKGLKEAQLLAQHSDPMTTLKYYLDQAGDKQLMYDWQAQYNPKQEEDKLDDVEDNLEEQDNQNQIEMQVVEECQENDNAQKEDNENEEDVVQIKT